MTDRDYDYSFVFFLVLILAALIVGLISTVCSYHDERKRADYWRDLAVDLAVRHHDQAVLDAAERER